MDLVVYENDKNLSLNGINKMIHDVYNDNLNFLLKKNNNELEKREEIDQFSLKIEALSASLEEETKRLFEEKDDMKRIFQNIAVQLKDVKKSIKKAEQCTGENNNGEIIKNSHKFFEDIKKDIDNL